MIKAKKSLGQNFLIDENILKKIVSVTNIEGRSILEIGPGTGNLTSFILKKNPKNVLVVEKDRNLKVLLKDKFHEKIKIILNDILDINEKLLSKEDLDDQSRFLISQKIDVLKSISSN